MHGPPGWPLSPVSLLPLRLISSVIPHCCPSLLLVILTVGISKKVQADSLFYAVPDAHGRDRPRPSPGRDGVPWGAGQRGELSPTPRAAVPGAGRPAANQSGVVLI